MDTLAPERVEAERSLGLTLFRWLPAITAIVAALATLLVALISWNASRSATDKDYVALAMNILASKDSSTPSRRWAVDVLSHLSPVDIPKDLASGLVTGRSVMPQELDPMATRRAILACLKPALESEIVKPVEAAPLPPKHMTVGDALVFGVQQTGQLEKANARIAALNDSVNICMSPPTPDR